VARWVPATGGAGQAALAWLWFSQERAIKTARASTALAYSADVIVTVSMRATVTLGWVVLAPWAVAPARPLPEGDSPRCGPGWPAAQSHVDGRSAWPLLSS
jgi:hypothetical protein